MLDASLKRPYSFRNWCRPGTRACILLAGLAANRNAPLPFPPATSTPPRSARCEKAAAIAVVGRAFAEQHHRIAFGEALRDLGIDLLRPMAARPVDEHRALQLGEQPEHRPARDLVLGDERHRRHRRDHGNIEPGAGIWRRSATDARASGGR